MGNQRVNYLHSQTNETTVSSHKFYGYKYYIL